MSCSQVGEAIFGTPALVPDLLRLSLRSSLHDAMCVVKRVLESGDVVPGGAAVEAALSVHLENYATSVGSREQLAIAEFAEALLVIPKTLAVNAALDATDLIARLRAFHHKAQTDEAHRDKKWYVSDLDCVCGSGWMPCSERARAHSALGLVRSGSAV